MNFLNKVHVMITIFIASIVMAPNLIAAENNKALTKAVVQYKAAGEKYDKELPRLQGQLARENDKPDPNQHTIDKINSKIQASRMKYVTAGDKVAKAADPITYKRLKAADPSKGGDAFTKYEKFKEQMIEKYVDKKG